MFRNVLVPVDGSAVVEHALPWALAAAEPAGTLHLVHAHVPPAPLLVEGAVIADPSIDQVMREQEADYLDKLMERLRIAAPALSIVARISTPKTRPPTPSRGPSPIPAPAWW